jgi:hypothetical protein
MSKRPVSRSSERWIAVANPSSQSCWSRNWLAPSRNSLGGSALSRPPSAPQSSRARVPAPWPFPETSTTATSRRPSTREATTKSPANGVPPADLSSLAAYHSAGRSGMPPWRHAESRATKGRQQHHQPEAEDDGHGQCDPQVDVLLARRDQGQDEEDEQHEPRQLPRTEHQAGEHQGHHQAGQRDVVLEAPDGEADQQRRADEQHQGARPPRDEPVRGCTERWRTHARAPPALPVPLVGDRRARDRNFG